MIRVLRLRSAVEEMERREVRGRDEESRGEGRRRPRTEDDAWSEHGPSSSMRPSTRRSKLKPVIEGENKWHQQPTGTLNENGDDATHFPATTLVTVLLLPTRPPQRPDISSQTVPWIQRPFLWLGRTKSRRSWDLNRIQHGRDSNEGGRGGTRS